MAKAVTHSQSLPLCGSGGSSAPSVSRTEFGMLIELTAPFARLPPCFGDHSTWSVECQLHVLSMCDQRNFAALSKQDRVTLAVWACLAQPGPLEEHGLSSPDFASAFQNPSKNILDAQIATMGTFHLPMTSMCLPRSACKRLLSAGASDYVNKHTWSTRPLDRA